MGFVFLQLEIIEGLGGNADPEPPLEDIRVNLVNPTQIFQENFVDSSVQTAVRPTMQPAKQLCNQ